MSTYADRLKNLDNHDLFARLDRDRKNYDKVQAKVREHPFHRGFLDKRDAVRDLLVATEDECRRRFGFSSI